MTPKPSRPLRLAGIYLLFSIVWILGSDLLLQALIADPATLAQLQTLKGLLFVAFSGLLILLLCRQDELNQQRLELDLRDQLLKLQQAQRDAGLGTWNYDGHLHWSAEALRLLGRPDSDNTGNLDDLLGWLYPADRSAVQRAMHNLLHGGSPLLVNARLNRPVDQEVVWLMLRGTQSSDGGADGMAAGQDGHGKETPAGINRVRACARGSAWRAWRWWWFCRSPAGRPS